jgi:hypothetical protein
MPLPRYTGTFTVMRRNKIGEHAVDRLEKRLIKFQTPVRVAYCGQATGLAMKLLFMMFSLRQENQII